MSGLFGGGSQPTTTPDYTGLQIQTAVNTLPIPIVWGKSRLAPNIVWYNNFQTYESSGGGKGSGGKGGLFSGGAAAPSAIPTAPRSSWLFARGRSPASIRSGRTNRSTR